MPGQNGIGACHASVSAPGTSAFCDCNGTPAPTLKPTNSDYINCAYSVLPTSSYDPKIPVSSTTSYSAPAETTTSSTPAATPTCKVHVWEGHGTYPIQDPQIALVASLTDGSGKAQGEDHTADTWNKAWTVKGTLPQSLTITPQLKSQSSRLVRRAGAPLPQWPPNEDSTLKFQYGSSTWRSTDSQCSVGGWDGGNFDDFVGTFLGFENYLLNRQMDCTFPCPAQGSKKRSSDVRDLEIRGDDANTTLVRRVVPDRSEKWTQFAGKGQQLYDAFAAAPMADVATLCDLERQYSDPPPIISGNNPDPKSRVILGTANIAVPPDAYYYLAYLDGNTNGATFSNVISPAAGAFLATFNSRGKPAVEETFSAVAWYQWVKTVKTVTPDATDFSGLKAMLRVMISNDDTIDILYEAVIYPQVDFFTTAVPYTPENRDLNENPFWAILGTPNGKGIIRLLTDYKKSMNGKALTSLKIQLIDNNWFILGTYG